MVGSLVDIWAHLVSPDTRYCAPGHKDGCKHGALLANMGEADATRRQQIEECFLTAPAYSGCMLENKSVHFVEGRALRGACLAWDVDAPSVWVPGFPPGATLRNFLHQWWGPALWTHPDIAALVDTGVGMRPPVASVTNLEALILAAALGLDTCTMCGGVGHQHERCWSRSLETGTIADGRTTVVVDSLSLHLRMRFGGRRPRDGTTVAFRRVGKYALV